MKIECEFTALADEFSICKIVDICEVDFSRPFVFLSKTDEEVSLVCESEYAPKNALAIEEGWRAFRVDGVLDFSLVGIIADITRILADAGISVFVVSTYNTDYVLLKSCDFERGLEILRVDRV